MSGSLAQVVAQLKSTIDQLDGLAVQANRAAEDVAAANAKYADAGRGTDHPKLRAAVTHSRTGIDKTHRLARLSSEAAQHIAAYLNAIAPGSAPPPATTETGPPSGEELLADSERRDLARAKVRGFRTRFVQKADEVQGQTVDTAKVIQQSIKTLRNPSGPSGTHSTGTGTPTGPGASPRSKIDGAEAAGNLVVVGLLVGVAAHRIASVISKRIVRFRKRERNPVERSDPRAGQG